jgi:quercetin dioxygenase-like cupin family protein
MDQLEKALKHDLQGELKTIAENRFRDKMTEWGIPLSKAPILVWDFGLRDFYRYGLAENWIANDTDAGYCGKYLFIMEGQTCPRHRHKLKRETFFILRGQVHLWYDGQDITMNPGDTITIERWKDHDFSGLEDSLILEISEPTLVDDNYFTTEGICYGQTLAEALHSQNGQ